MSTLALSTTGANPEVETRSRLPALKRALLVILLTWAVASPFIELRQIQAHVPGYWSDFFSPWTATRAVLHGRDPYSGEVAGEIQRWFYHRALTPNDDCDTQAFVYPAYSIFLFAPVAVLPWWAVRLLFSFLLPALVALSVWLWMKMCALQYGPWKKAALLVLITASWPAVWATQQMQPTVMVFAALTGACFLLRGGRDLPAGVILAIATIKPNLVAPLMVWLILWAIAQRRIRFLASLGISLAALLAAAEAILPGWIPRWYAAILIYSRNTHKPPLLLSIFSRGGHAFAYGASLLLIGLACAVLYRLGLPEASAPNFARAIALILAFTACLIPGTFWMLYNHLLLIPGVFVLLLSRARGYPAKPARDLALALASWEVSGVAVCVAISLIMGSPGVRPMLPFLAFFLPAAVATALLCISPSWSGDKSVRTTPASRSRDRDREALSACEAK